MATRLNKDAIRALFDIAKTNVYMKDGKIHWKRLDFSNDLSHAFHSLSVQNRNRIIYYGATIHKLFQNNRCISKIKESLDMNNYYEADSEKSILVLFHKLFGSDAGAHPSLIMSDLLTDTTIADIATSFNLFVKRGEDTGTMEEKVATNYFFEYATLLLINIEYDGSYKIFNVMSDSINNLDFDDFISRIFFLSGLPEPTLDYFKE